ncbi:MAG: BBP7 family outer membrane beta-barrel protein, partial [Pirellulales bacterium]|nr:BBP7 family outer membrane beta-barrel protein [Pirellulales bacterium]
MTIRNQMNDHRKSQIAWLTCALLMLWATLAPEVARSADSNSPRPEPVATESCSVCDTCDAAYGVDGTPGCGCDTACDAIGSVGALPNASWVSAEYLLWSLDAMDLPPLVTTSPAGTAPEDTGVLGQAGTQLLFGGDGVGDSLRSGGRFSLGWWLNHRQRVGYEASLSVISRDDTDFSAGSDRIANLARPVFNTLLGSEASMLVAHTDFLSGNLSVRADNELQMVDLLRRECLSRSNCHRLDLLLGYRFARLNESLRIDQFSTFDQPQGQIIAGTTISLFDDFEAENHFHGGQLGVHYTRTSGIWSLGILARVALGVNNADVDINGVTVNTVPGAGSASFVGGLLAQETNIGSYEQSDLTAIPELGLTLTSSINQCTDFSVGYNLIYWGTVARVADQIDRNVSQFPPEPPSGT